MKYDSDHRISGKRFWLLLFLVMLSDVGIVYLSQQMKQEGSPIMSCSTNIPLCLTCRC